jgi:hypothetical protein
MPSGGTPQNDIHFTDILAEKGICDCGMNINKLFKSGGFYNGKY